MMLAIVTFPRNVVATLGDNMSWTVTRDGVVTPLGTLADIRTETILDRVGPSGGEPYVVAAYGLAEVWRGTVTFLQQPPVARSEVVH